MTLFRRIFLSFFILTEGAFAGPIRFLLPSRPLALGAHKETVALIDEYNRAHPATPVQLIRRGEDLSSLRDLIAMVLAGDAPELAVIEAAEGPAIAHLSLAKAPFIPFERSDAVLLVNEEALARSGLGTAPRPRTWAELSALTAKLAARRESPDAVALALPLQGPRGLWLLEALTFEPLWKREEGGLKSNRRLSETIVKLQTLIDAPGVARSDETWDHALQSFIEGKAILLATSRDMLPMVTEHTRFKWSTLPLPSLAAKPGRRLETGTNLVITSDTAPVREFVNYLTSPTIAARWTKAYGMLPPGQGGKTAFQPRSTDRDVVRARSAWIQALHLVFGERAKRLPLETVFIQLDRHLGS